MCKTNTYSISETVKIGSKCDIRKGVGNDIYKINERRKN